MNNINIKTLLSALLTCCLWVSPQVVSAQSPFEPPPLPQGEVAEIRIDGTRRVEQDAVLNVIETAVGDTLDRAQLRLDLLSIRNLGIGGVTYFDDVQIDVFRASTGTYESASGNPLVLTFLVSERAVLDSIDYEFPFGSELEEELLDVVDIEVGDVFDLSRVRENLRKIEELYREESYFLAHVEERFSENDSGDIDLTFVVSEYEEVVVRRINFVGNEVFEDDDLSEVIATRAGSLLGFLTGAGVYRAEEFENDRHRLRLFYYDNGYIDVEIGEHTVEIGRDLTEIYVTIPLVEGDQYTVKEVSVSGDMLLDEATLQDSYVSLEPGDVYSSTRVRQDLDMLSTYYKDEGYANVNINLGTDQDPETDEIGLVYDIQQGDPVYIGQITIIGNDTTRDSVIRREMRIHESDLYNGSALRTSRARVERLGFFESVNIREISTADPQVINLEVEIVERSTGQFQVGAGFSSVENFIATATISQNNLFGRGQALSLQASLSAIRTIFSLSFTEPYLLGTRGQFGFEVFNQEILYTDFTRGSMGFSLTGGYPVTDDLILSTTYQLEDVEVEPGGRTGSTERQVSNLFVGGLTSSVRTDLNWDTRNNRLFPSEGFLNSIGVEVADEHLGSENEFIRLRAMSRWYTRLFDVLVLKFNTSLGYVGTTDNEQPVPIFERFFIGGPNSVRGFERATLSPLISIASDPGDPSSLLAGFPTGGNKELIFNFELEFPILSTVGIRGVFFADAGNAFSESESYTLDMDLLHPDRDDYGDLLRTAVGFGFRWFSPIGPLRFEWGFPLSPLEDEESSVFEFSIGNFL